MGGKSEGLRKQIFLYAALCLTFVCCGCAFTGAGDGGFAGHYGKGECTQAYDALETLKRALNDRDLFGYVIMFSDKDCGCFDEELAAAYYGRMKNIYPDSQYTAYAGHIMNLFEKGVNEEKKNSELTDALELGRKKLQETEVQNKKLTESLKTSEEDNKKISEENKELNERIRALNKENESIRNQLEKMKEVDMKIGGKIIGK